MQDNNNLYTIHGHIGSPYSMKMRAVMRYRRIPHVWKDGGVGIDHARQRAPYTFRWILHMHDLSGFEGEWRPDSEPLPDIIEKLLQIAGEFYFPFLLANAVAAEAGEKEFSFEAGGMSYTQGVFKYQIKCLAALRQAYADLSNSAKTELSDLLEKTGCLAYLQAAV